MADAVLDNTLDPASNTPAQVAPGVVAPKSNQPLAPVINTGASNDQSLGLQDVMNFKLDTLKSEQEANVANNAVAQTTQHSLDQLYDSNIGAYNNLMKIQRWGGDKNPIIKVMSLFDSDWSQAAQTTQIQENSLTADQLARRAQTQIDINNQTPALAAKKAEIADTIFKYQVQGRELNQKDKELNQQDVKISQEATRIGLEIGRERRAQVEFAISGLSHDQLVAQNELAKKGKGQYAGVQGLLEHAINQSEMASYSLDAARNAALTGDDAATHTHMVNLVSQLPSVRVMPLIQQAQKNNDAFITFGKGDNAFKVPITWAMEGAAKAANIEDTNRAQVAASAADDAQIPARLDNIQTAAAAMATADPRAAQELQIVNNKLQTVDQKNYADIKAFGDFLKISEKRMDGVTNDVAATFKSPDAQGAVKQFGKTGRMTQEGGKAVLGDSIPLPGAATGKYKGAWRILNSQIAAKIASDAVGRSVDPSSMSNADVAMWLSQSKAKSTGQLRDEVLADSGTIQQLSSAVSSNINMGGAITTLKRLAGSKGASQVWTNLLNHPETIGQQNGSTWILDPNKLISELETQTTLTGGKVDYNHAFITALRETAASADKQYDPSITIYDRALESYLFGTAPQSIVLNDFTAAMQQAAYKAHAEMQARISKDLSGSSTSDAALQQASNARTGMPVDPNAVLNPPSATGTGLTVTQIRALYGK